MAIDVALKWWTEHPHPDEKWIQTYWESRKLPSRAAVVQGLRLLEPWKSLVELGCHCGPMLAEILAAYPQGNYIGVEPNPVAAEAALTLLPDTVQISCGSLQEWLNRGHPVDVFVTHYTLAYVPPYQLRQVLIGMLHWAKQGLVIAEPMGPEQLLWPNGEWRHDYLSLLNTLGIPECHVAEIQGDGNMNMVLVVPK